MCGDKKFLSPPLPDSRQWIFLSTVEIWGFLKGWIADVYTAANVAKEGVADLLWSSIDLYGYSCIAQSEDISHITTNHCWLVKPLLRRYRGNLFYRCHSTPEDVSVIQATSRSRYSPFNSFLASYSSLIALIAVLLNNTVPAQTSAAGHHLM